MAQQHRTSRLSRRAIAMLLGFLACGALTASAAVASAKPRSTHAKHLPICLPHHRTARCIRVPHGVGAPHRNQDASGGPGFSGQSVDGLGATNAGEQGAVDWAYERLGNQSFDGWCGKFVAYAFNVPDLGYATAWDAAIAFGLHGGTPPPGSLVFFKRDASNGWAGHIGIALAGDQMISAESDGVQVTSLGLAYWAALYAGWSPPPVSWPGRPPTGGAAPPLFPAAPTPTPPPSSIPTPTSPSTPGETQSSPPGTPAPTSYVYHVVGTCDEGACGLIERAGPGYSEYAEVGVLQEGAEIDIVCQTMGQPVTGRYATSAVWDRLTNGSYVSDYYTDTPNVGTWSPPIPQC